MTKNYTLQFAGKSYKEVLPSDKWYLIEHFLATLCRLDRRARDEGRRLDLDIFLQEYVRIYARGTKEAEML